jgi:hypothetical protein
MKELQLSVSQKKAIREEGINRVSSEQSPIRTEDELIVALERLMQGASQLPKPL